MPHTIKEVQRLEVLLKAELPRARAEQNLYNILGDDRLYDSFNEYGPEDDVRFLIAHPVWASFLTSRQIRSRPAGTMRLSHSAAQS